MKAEAYKTSGASCEVSTSSLSSLDPCSKTYVSSPSSSVAAQKQDMLDDLQEKVPEIEWRFFTNHVLPAIPRPVHLDKVIQRLKDAGDIVEDAKGNEIWAAFKRSTSTSKLFTDETENETFKGFQAVVTAIKEASGNRHRAKRLFRCNPDRAPLSENRDNNTRPDGYYLRNPVSGALNVKKPLWSDVIVPCEFKLRNSDKDKNTNWQQIIWSLNHLMREDPARRFVLGFTIEKTDLRIWFVSRSDVFVSSAVNFLTDIRSVVDLFLRLQFAEDHELGIDETVTRLNAPDPTRGVQYDIRVGDKVYRTQRLISSIGAESMRGRGTRVWEVKEVDAKGHEVGDPMILKDSWGGKSRPREFDISTAIRNTSTPHPMLKTLLDNHLLTYVDSWDVTLMTRDGEKEDSTREVMLRGGTPVWTTVLRVQKDYEASKRVVQKHPAQGVLSNPKKSDITYVEYGEKIHHRVIIKEVGTTIVEAGTLSKAFAHLSEVAKGLSALHSAGWVHRDISVGNIIIHDGQTKLGDVEYAKREADDTTHDVRTGTAFFMAAEVHNGQYSHNPLPLPNTGDPNDDSRAPPASNLNTVTVQNLAGDQSAPLPFDYWEQPADEVPQKVDDEPAPVMFKHNPLHDLESLLWLAFYLLLCTILHLPRPADVSDEQCESYQRAQDKLAADIFHNMCTRGNMTITDAFSALLIGLHPRVYVICKKLDDVRKALKTAYMESERDSSTLSFMGILSLRLALPSQPDQLMSLHRLFATRFTSISKMLQEEGDIPFTSPYTIPQQRQQMAAVQHAEEKKKVGKGKATKRAQTTGAVISSESSRSRRGRRGQKSEDPEVLELSRQYKTKLRPPQ